MCVWSDLLISSKVILSDECDGQLKDSCFNGITHLLFGCKIFGFHIKKKIRLLPACIEIACSCFDFLDCFFSPPILSVDVDCDYFIVSVRWHTSHRRNIGRNDGGRPQINMKDSLERKNVTCCQYNDWIQTFNQANKHIFGMWAEAGVPGQIPHRETMKAPHRSARAEIQIQNFSTVSHAYATNYGYFWVERCLKWSRLCLSVFWCVLRGGVNRFRNKDGQCIGLSARRKDAFDTHRTLNPAPTTHSVPFRHESSPTVKLNCTRGGHREVRHWAQRWRNMYKIKLNLNEE